jgi:hypothetical protein
MQVKLVISTSGYISVYRVCGSIFIPFVASSGCFNPSKLFVESCRHECDRLVSLLMLLQKATKT